MSRNTRRQKTLYDKTLAGRLKRTSRRTRRVAVNLTTLGLFVGGGVVALSPAQATPYGGFSSMATASPLKLEIFEPAIPIPTVPQFEINLSYTRVLGDSGPATTARASAFWPGPAVGEGMKTFGEQLGLPGALTDGGYPVQVNAAYPSDQTQQVQEYFPGMIGRVNAGEKRTTAKNGYTGSDINDGDAGDGATASTNPLEAITKGDLTALGSLLTGTKTGSTDNPASANPLGALGLLIDFDGMTSVSSADYDGDTVTTTATSRIGELRLLLGLIKMTGINVVTKVTSTLDGGAKTSQVVDVGGMTIAGKKFAFGPEGFEVAGSTTPAPDLGAVTSQLLKTIGVAIEVPKPVIAKGGASGSVEAQAVRITIDTKVLRSKFPAIPFLDDIVNSLPALPGQANLLKGLLLSLNTAAPKLVLHLGYSSSSATTVPAVEFGPTDPGAIDPGGTGAIDPGVSGPIDAGTPPVEATGPPVVTVPPVGFKPPGLPPLGSVPLMLLLAGLALAGGLGWWLRQAGLILFGGGAACSHGLKAGIPDLRKV